MVVNFMCENHECYILFDDEFAGYIEFEWERGSEIRHVVYYANQKLGLGYVQETYHEAIRGTNFKSLRDSIEMRARLVAKAKVINSFKERYRTICDQGMQIDKEKKSLRHKYYEKGDHELLWSYKPDDDPEREKDRKRYQELFELNEKLDHESYELSKEEDAAIREACNDIEIKWNWIWY